MHELRVRPEAERDIEDAAGWYEQQRPGLGQEFLDEVLGSLRRITEQPDVYPTVHRETPRVLTHRFPFGGYYRVDREMIVGVAVLHGSRDPCSKPAYSNERCAIGRRCRPSRD